MVYHPIVVLVQTYFHSFNGVSSHWEPMIARSIFDDLEQ